MAASLQTAKAEHRPHLRRQLAAQLAMERIGDGVELDDIATVGQRQRFERQQQPVLAWSIDVPRPSLERRDRHAD
jgi:hypothetical protein